MTKMAIKHFSEKSLANTGTARFLQNREQSKMNTSPWKKQRNSLSNSDYKPKYPGFNKPKTWPKDDSNVIVIEDSGSHGDDAEDPELDELMDTFVFTLEQIISAMLRKYNKPNAFVEKEKK